MKEKTGKLDFIKINNLSVKDTIKKNEERKKTLAKYISDKGLLCKIHKILKFNSKKTTQFKNVQKI